MSAPGRRRLAAGELVVLAVFWALGLLTLGLIAWSAAIDGRIWSGAIGPSVDSMQYLSWIRESAFHGLIGNRFQLGPVDRVFLHPAMLVSGGLHRLGVSVPIAYALWVPVGLFALSAGAVAYIRRLVEGNFARAVALSLALLSTAPALLNVARSISPEGRGARFIVFDAWPLNWLWGYPLTAISVGLLCLVLLGHERARVSGRAPLWLAFAGLLCAWFQPWQGAILVAVLVACELLRIAEGDRAARSLARLGPTILLAAGPLVYYATLGQTDPSWHEHGIQDNLYESVIPWWSIPLVLGPLALPALATLKRSPANFQIRAAQLWVLFAVLLFAFIQITQVGTFASHSVQGVMIPLAALAVTGVQRITAHTSRQWLVIPALVVAVLLVVPGVISSTSHQVKKVRAANSGYFITAGERNALQMLAADPRAGGVLATVRLGSQVPWRTGRNSWLGHESWTPKFIHRSVVAAMIFGDAGPRFQLDATQATGAKFVVSDCTQAGAAIVRLLAHADNAQQQFGCATVTTLRR